MRRRDAGQLLSRRAFGAALGSLAACVGARAKVDPAPALVPLPEPAPGAAAQAPQAPTAPTASGRAGGAGADAELALVRAFPALATTLPRARLATLPTPVERSPTLERRLGAGLLLVKRDDESGEAYGGGKTRKLELFLGEALASGSRSVATFGAVGSNHALATAIYADRLGLRALLLLLPGPASDDVRRHLSAMVRHGAVLALSPGGSRAEAAAKRQASERWPGEAPYVIPVGGSSPLGNIAFVSAAFELREQLQAGGLPEPDDIYIPLGTTGSAVGLAVGLRAAGLRSRVVAVRASSPATSSAGHVAAAFDATVASLRARDPSFPALSSGVAGVSIDGRHLGRGYGLSTPAAERAVRIAADDAELALETTYTGKTLAAMLDLAPSLRGRTVLFWNTHDGRPLDAPGADPAELPPAFRGYFATGR